MVWPPPSQPSDSVFATLCYSDQFDYPLSLSELWFWQPFTHYSKSRLSGWPYSQHGYFFLANRSGLVNLRLARAKISQRKWPKALSAGRLLRFIPSLQAIFVTGALAMHNSPVNDDIDIMLMVSPHTLWFTRLAVVFLLKLFCLRRPSHLPHHSSPAVRDKICDNLYLDTDHLSLSARSLYLAHEILQAKCLFDRGEVHHRFLLANSWTKKYLPIAYRGTLKSVSAMNHEPITHSRVFSFLLFTVNCLLFTLQYLYMRSRLTNEKIGLGYAFFHPRPFVASAK